jgi:hypothetical protein
MISGLLFFRVFWAFCVCEILGGFWLLWSFFGILFVFVDGLSNEAGKSLRGSNKAGRQGLGDLVRTSTSTEATKCMCQLY